MTIIFFPVKNTPDKLYRLAKTAALHLEKKEPLLFLVPDKNSFEFLDKLLWSTPPESFLPHPTPILAVSTELLPHFPAVFNLRPVALLDPVKTIFELEDHTSSEKFQLSKHRYQTYREQNFPISIEI